MGYAYDFGDQLFAKKGSNATFTVTVSLNSCLHDDKI